MICPKYKAFSFETFRANLFLATHSETNCCSLLSVAGISIAVVAEVYSVESSAYIDTLALLNAMSLVMGYCVYESWSKRMDYIYSE